VILLLLMIIPFHLLAETLHVPGEHALIQIALNAAESGDTVLVAPGTYEENLQWPATSGIILSGTQLDSCIIDGSHSGSVIRFHCDWGSLIDSTTHIQNFTIQNGYASYGAGIYLCNAGPTLSSLLIRSNEAIWGGGMDSRFSKPRLDQIQFLGNEAEYGGAIHSVQYWMELDHVLIADNQAEIGAAILNEYSYINLEHVTISGNRADYGGGIFCYSALNTILHNSIVWDNVPEQIYFWHTGDPSLVTISFSDVQGGPDSAVTNDMGEIAWLDGNLDEDPFFCNAPAGDYGLAENSPCAEAGETGIYMGSHDVSCGPVVAAHSTSSPPCDFVLGTPFPNPFNPVTTIAYTLPELQDVQFDIYDLQGRRVKKWTYSEQRAGWHQLTWNGLDAAGEQLATGIYLGRLTAGPHEQTIKMLLLR